MAGVVDRPSSAWSRTLRRALARVAASAGSAGGEVLEAEAGAVELVGQPGQVGELGFHVVPAAQAAEPSDQVDLEPSRVAVVVVDDDERVPAVEV